MQEAARGATASQQAITTLEDATGRDQLGIRDRHVHGQGVIHRAALSDIANGEGRGLRV
jgi:hypothetical protein